MPNNIVNQLLENFKSNFLSIKKIYCTSYIKSYCIKDYFDRYENKFFFDVGYEKSCLVVYCENKIKLVKFFPLGGNHVTKDIAKIFKISILEAEKIKKNLNNSNITFSIFSMGGNIVKKGVFCTYLSLFSWYLRRIACIAASPKNPYEVIETITCIFRSLSIFPAPALS